MKKTAVRRLFAGLLVLVMALSAVPFGVLAEGAAPQEAGTAQGTPETPKTPETPETPKTPENPETPKTPEAPKGETAQNPGEKTDAPASLEGEGNPIVSEEKTEKDPQKPVCVCEESGPRCTRENCNKDCPVCAEKDADLEEVCKGSPQEQLTTEAETKRAAEEEAARKAAEEAAKKAAEEEAAKKAAEEAAQKAAEEAAQEASEEAVKNVQALIDALPDANAITEENREAVEAALNAIDDAKGQLTDEELGKLDFTRYDAAAEALNALEGIPRAGVPVTLETPETIMATITVMLDGQPCYSGNSVKWYVEVKYGDKTVPYEPEKNQNSVEITGEKPRAGNSYSLTVYMEKGDEKHTVSRFWRENLEKTVNFYTVNAQWEIVFAKSGFFENATVNEDKIKKYLKENFPTYTTQEVTKAEFRIEAKNELSWQKIEANIHLNDDTARSYENIAKNARMDIRIPGICQDKCYTVTYSDGNALSNGESYRADGDDLLLENFLPGYYSFTEHDAVTITYDASGGTVDGATTASERVAKGVEHTLKTPTRTGYNFIGWYRLGGDGGRFTKLTPTEDVTLYAQWIPIHYHVYFNPDGGEVVKGESMIQQLQYKEDFSKQVPTVRKAGKMFCYWKYYESGKKVETFEKLTDQEGETVDLIAEWANATCSFESENGQTTVEITSGDGKLTALPDPGTKAGYAFLGWYLYEIDDKQGNIENVNIRVTLDTVFYGASKLRARWVKTTADGSGALAGTLTPEQIEGILWNETPNADYSDTIEILISSANAAATDAIRAKARELLGGEPSRLDCLEITVSANNMPKHELGKTILLDLGSRADYGSSLKILRTHNGATAEIPQGKPADDVTEGWYVENGRIYLAVRNFSLYALASAPYTVTFDSQGGSEVSAMKAGADGKLAAMPANPTKTGYTFDGWYLTKDGTGTKVDENYQFTGDATVYAKWTANAYTVTFHANYGSTDTTATQSFTYDVSQALDCGSKIQRDYYKLTGWAETTDGEKKYDGNETVRNLSAEPNGKKDLYALWEYVPRTVTFDANGVDNNGKATKGTVTEDGTEKASVERKTQESPINTLKTLPVPNAQEGYYFEGWYYKDRANKEQPVEIGKTEFTADTTVYAKWKVFEPVTVTLKCQRGTMRIDGKDVSTGTMQTKWPGVLDGTLPTPARSGYKFEGWYTYAGVKVDENTVFLRDTTVYARWKSAVSRTGNPKTGDQIALEAAVAVLVIAAVGLGAAVIIKKKQNKK